MRTGSTVTCVPMETWLPITVGFQHSRLPPAGPQQFTHRSGDILIPQISFREPIKVEINHFFDCILEGTPCLTGPDHAREVIRILSAAKS